MDYRKEIDGLRGLAVSFVILSHGGISIFNGGYIGVDIFFVISGYLIFNILRGELKEGKFSLLKFYERRARRILPALFTMLLVTIPFSWLFLMPRELEDFGKSLISVIFFASNFLFWRESGYFEAAAELKPLLHTWSLGVEEQFYIFFPIFLALIWKYKKYLFIVVFTCFFVSLLVAEWASFFKPWPNFYLLPTRGWEILAGVFGAMMNEKISDGKYRLPLKHHKLYELLSGIGLLMILGSLMIFDSNTRHPSLFTLIPVIGTLLILTFTFQRQTFVARVLSAKGLTLVGITSYSLYLWHQPVLAFAKSLNLYQMSTLPYFLVLIFMLSWMSFKLIEVPFRNASAIPSKTILVCLFLSISTILFFGFYFVFNKGLPSRLSENQINILKFEKYQPVKYYDKGNCLLLDTFDKNIAAGTCDLTPKNEKNTVMLWGDSFAAHLHPALRDNENFATQLFATSCPPLFGYKRNENSICVAAEQKILDHLQHRNPSTIILAANWLKHQSSLSRLERTLQEIRLQSPNSNIVLFGNLPQWHPSLPQSLARAKLVLEEVKYLWVPKLEKLRKIDSMLNTVAENSNVEFIPVLEKLCKKTSCLIKADESIPIRLMAFDYGHLTIEGGEKVMKETKLIEKILQGLNVN